MGKGFNEMWYQGILGLGVIIIIIIISVYYRAQASSLNETVVYQAEPARGGEKIMENSLACRFAYDVLTVK
ncbi:jg13742 [Pararge aegeria aegeria]|uniref:Jg13742 protein n=1 Tax=Pararge aegeria aegeria TaxID=348720 RepID=A0A8S4RNQ4_9NEOP|nr:jg13742 [Pararge aegeria aegeria]